MRQLGARGQELGTTLIVQFCGMYLVFIVIFICSVLTIINVRRSSSCPLG